MNYRGYTITEDYHLYSWQDPNASRPVNNLCKTVKEAEGQIDEHLLCIEHGELSAYETDKES